MPEQKVAKSSRGSKPGERRGGRKAGVPNKMTADIKALARDFTAAAMKELGRIALNAESDQARVAAIKELFDRGWGRSTTIISGDDDGGPVQVVIKRLADS